MTKAVRGVHVVRRKLADGTTVEYHYAWRGGPRIEGKPGSAGYLHSLASHRLDRRASPGGTMAKLIKEYKASAEFARLRASTKANYERYLALVEAKFGERTLAELEGVAFRPEVLAWQAELAGKTRKADLAVTVLKVVLGWGAYHSKLKANQAAGVRRLSKANKSESVWTEEDFATAAVRSTPQLWKAILLARYTGLRQGDLLKLTWASVKERTIELATSKTGQRVIVPLVKEARALLAERGEDGEHVLLSARGRAWTEAGFATAMQVMKKGTSIEKTFHDLRRTAATEFFKAGLNVSEVALIMGWTEKDAEAMKRVYVSKSSIVEGILARLDK